ncbi:hypothetical protein [Acaryochloris sp. IP29b_bin.137]|nr:hypothetical protein [Acaryochloris sp. IP29b_bin.137]
MKLSCDRSLYMHQDQHIVPTLFPKTPQQDSASDALPLSFGLNTAPCRLL